ncbi:hypothetical protein ABK040_010154 [Willaertia magna]
MLNKEAICVLILVILGVTLCTSQDTKTIEWNENVLLNETVTIPKDTHLIIKPGVVVTFVSSRIENESVKLLIHGSLTANGTNDLPIIFQSYNIITNTPFYKTNVWGIVITNPNFNIYNCKFIKDITNSSYTNPSLSLQLTNNVVDNNPLNIILKDIEIIGGGYSNGVGIELLLANNTFYLFMENILFKNVGGGIKMNIVNILPNNIIAINNCTFQTVLSSISALFGKAKTQIEIENSRFSFTEEIYVEGNKVDRGYFGVYCVFEVSENPVANILIVDISQCSFDSIDNPIDLVGQRLYAMNSNFTNYNNAVTGSAMSIAGNTFKKSSSDFATIVALSPYISSSMVVMKNTFLDLSGPVIVTNHIIYPQFLFKSISFSQNIIMNSNCGPSGIPFINIKEKYLTLTQFRSNDNQFYNNYCQSSMILVDSPTAVLFFSSKNKFIENIANNAVFVNLNNIDRRQFSFEQNIFMNTHNINGDPTHDVFIKVSGTNDSSINLSHNYWGTSFLNNDNQLAIYNFIKGRVNQLSDKVQLIPYFLSEDVNNYNSSNLGYGVVANSSIPTLSSSYKPNDNDMDLQTILIIFFSVVGGFFVFFSIFIVIGSCYKLLVVNRAQYQQV